MHIYITIIIVSIFLALTFAAWVLQREAAHDRCRRIIRNVRSLALTVESPDDFREIFNDGLLELAFSMPIFCKEKYASQLRGIYINAMSTRLQTAYNASAAPAAPPEENISPEQNKKNESTKEPVYFYREKENTRTVQAGK